MLVVNGLIGAGIFGLPSGAYALAGEYSVFVYIFCALLMLPVILSFAEVGSYFRGTGGPIKYGKEAFGSFIGFQGGWLYYLARLISFSANTVLLTDSIAYFFPIADSGTGRLISLALTCLFLAGINILGSMESIRSMTFFTIIKFGVLIGLVIGGFSSLGIEVLPNLDAPLPSGSDLGKAALLLIYAFVGFEGAVVPAGEAKRPERDMPLGLLLGLGVVALIYILVQLVAQAAVPNLAESTAPLLDASSQLFGQTGAVLLMVGVATSVLAPMVWGGSPPLLDPGQFRDFLRGCCICTECDGLLPVFGSNDCTFPALFVYHDLRSSSQTPSKIPLRRKVYSPGRLSGSCSGDFVLSLADAAGEFHLGLVDSYFGGSWYRTVLVGQKNSLILDCRSRISNFSH
jgi:hypothetical protein